MVGSTGTQLLRRSVSAAAGTLACSDLASCVCRGPQRDT